MHGNPLAFQLPAPLVANENRFCSLFAPALKDFFNVRLAL
jgi:hypothetical protein